MSRVPWSAALASVAALLVASAYGTSLTAVRRQGHPRPAPVATAPGAGDLGGAPGATGAPAPAGLALPVAERHSPQPQVGVLFVGRWLRHQCNATVVQSRSQNLLVTAGHCVRGNKHLMLFVPGYDGSAPFGVWRVDARFGDDAWRTRLATTNDFAVLRVAPRHGRRLQQVVGGLPAGAAPAPGSPVLMLGYNRDSTAPLGCSTTAGSSGRYPQFRCRGYARDSSGAPILGRGPTGGWQLQGVIGGPHFGGCTLSTSFSAPFGLPLQMLLGRASAARHGDLMPRPGKSGCHHPRLQLL